jgi:hypothetical protein
MSYCRWSSMDFTCDIYAYESDGGFVVHVASGRFVDESREETKPIGLPHDGATYYHDTEDEMFATMKELAAEGYNVPPHLIEDDQ